MSNEKYYKPFSDDEIKFLYENNGQMSLAEVSEKLGRTEASLRYKIKNLNKSCPSNIIKMKRKQKKKPDVLPENWRPETNCTVPCICSAVYRGEPFEQIAEDIDRTVEQVIHIYERSLENGDYRKIVNYQERLFQVAPG